MLLSYEISAGSVSGQQIDSVSLAAKAAESHGIYLNNPERSIQIAGQLISEATEVDNTYFIGYGNYLLSKAYWAKGNYQLSAKYGFIALNILEGTPYKYMWGETLVGLARTLTDLKNLIRPNSSLSERECWHQVLITRS